MTTSRMPLDLRGVFESVPDAMVILDAAGEIVLVNAQTERLFGYPRTELVGRRFELLVSSVAGEVASGRLRAGGPPRRACSTDPAVERRGRRKDGGEFAIEMSSGPVETAGQTLVSSTIRDITGRKEANESAAHFRAVVEQSHDAIIGKTLDGLITSWNRGAQRLYGYTLEEMLGKSVAVLIPPGHDDDLPEILAKLRAGERVEDFETVRVCKDGTHVDVSLTASPMRDIAGSLVGASTIARDIGVRLRYQEQLRFLAEHDALTGVTNRRRFERDVREQIGRSRRYGEQAALLIIDLDGFKQVNDMLGHCAGDDALKDVATAFRHRLRATDIVARIGGDEFAILLPYADAAQAVVVSDDLRRIIGECVIAAGGGAEVRLSASVGSTQIDRDTQSEETALAAADRAMYRDKANQPPIASRAGSPVAAAAGESPRAA